MQEKISLDQLLTDYFKSTDTITVNAAELQKYLVEKNKTINKLKNDNKKLSDSNNYLTNNNSYLLEEANALNEKLLDIQSTIALKPAFILDLKA